MNWIAIEHWAYASSAVLGTLAVTVLFALLLRRPGFRAWVATLDGLAPPFLNAPATLFGLTLAFIAADTWASRDRAIEAVFREAEGMHTLLIMAQALPDPQATALDRAVRAYGQAVVDEWPELADSKEDRNVAQTGDALLALVAGRGFGAVAGDPLQGALLAKVAEVRSERDLRASLTRMHLNPLKWLGMALLGFLTLLSIAVVHAANPRAGLVGVIIFATAAAPSAAVVLVQGNPFQQPAAVSPHEIIEVVGPPTTG